MADKKSSPEQITQSVYEVQSNAISVRDATNLVPSSYNEILMTYIATNPEPSTVTYLQNSVIIAVIAFEYDVRGRVTRVYRQS
jgi:hypothetical protein